MGRVLWCVLLGTRLDAMWCGWGTRLRAGDGADRLRGVIARCVLRGRAAMDAGNELGPEGAASLAPALERMTQLASLDLEGARIRIGRGTGGLKGPGPLVLAVGYALGMRCGVVGVLA